MQSWLWAAGPPGNLKKQTWSSSDHYKISSHLRLRGHSLVLRGGFREESQVRYCLIPAMWWALFVQGDLQVKVSPRE
jgi:hypothetical protein